MPAHTRPRKAGNLPSTTASGLPGRGGSFARGKGNSLDAKRIFAPGQPVFFSADGGVTMEAAAAGGAAGENGSPVVPGNVRFSGVLYSGGALNNWFGQWVVDLDTLEMPQKKVPTLFGHWAGIGFMDKITRTARGLEVTGSILTEGETPLAAEIRDLVLKARGGYPWEMSIGVEGEGEFIGEGAKATVNGREFTGPLYIVRKGRIREGSIVEIGADPKTQTSLAASARARAARRTSGEQMVDIETMTVEELRSLRPDLCAAIEEEVSDMNDTNDDGADAVKETTASLEALEGHPRLKGRSDLILRAMREKMTMTQAVALAGEADAAEVTRLKTENAELTKRLDAAGNSGADAVVGASAGGDGPGAGSGGGSPGKFKGAAGTDPERDWEASADLRAYWEGQCGKEHAYRAFIGYARQCQREHETWLEPCFA